MASGTEGHLGCKGLPSRASAPAALWSRLVLRGTLTSPPTLCPPRPTTGRVSGRALRASLWDPITLCSRWTLTRRAEGSGPASDSRSGQRTHSVCLAPGREDLSPGRKGTLRWPGERGAGDARLGFRFRSLAALRRVRTRDAAFLKVDSRPEPARTRLRFAPSPSPLKLPFAATCTPGCAARTPAQTGLVSDDGFFKHSTLAPFCPSTGSRDLPRGKPPRPLCLWGTLAEVSPGSFCGQRSRTSDVFSDLQTNSPGGCHGTWGSPGLAWPARSLLDVAWERMAPPGPAGAQPTSS